MTNLLKRVFTNRASGLMTLLVFLPAIPESALAQSTREIGEQFLQSMDAAYAARDIDAYANLFHEDLTYNVNTSIDSAAPQSLSLTKPMMLQVVPQSWSLASDYAIQRRDIQVTVLDDGNLLIGNEFTETMTIQGLSVTNEAEEFITLEVVGDAVKAIRWETVSSVTTAAGAQGDTPGITGQQDEPLAGNRRSGDILLESVSLETAFGQVDFELGTIFVPENRSDPDARLIGVGFARFRGTESTGAPPTFPSPRPMCPPPWTGSGPLAVMPTRRKNSSTSHPCA